MSDKNLYESIRDDAATLAKNALGTVVVIGLVILLLLYYVVIAILQAIAFLLFCAAAVVLITIPVYLVLEWFYYGRFSNAREAPSRYRTQRQRAEKLLNALVRSRTDLEARMSQPDNFPRRRSVGELEPIRAREAGLHDVIHRVATLEANWLTERLNAIDFRRIGLLRRFGSRNDAPLANRVLALEDDVIAIQAQLDHLRLDYGVAPDQSATQPAVVYVRRVLHVPFRLIHVEPYAPRLSGLLSHWAIFVFVLAAAGLATLIVALGLESNLFQ